MAILDRKEDYLHIRWAQEVKRRDGFACVICGRNGYLNAHHKNAYASFPEQRYDVDNGVTLCQQHHDEYHSIYGKGRNTEDEFEEFQKIMSKLHKTARVNAIKVNITEAIKKKLIILDEIRKKVEEDGNS